MLCPASIIPAAISARLRLSITIPRTTFCVFGLFMVKSSTNRATFSFFCGKSIYRKDNVFPTIKELITGIKSYTNLRR